MTIFHVKYNVPEDQIESFLSFAEQFAPYVQHLGKQRPSPVTKTRQTIRHRYLLEQLAKHQPMESKELFKQAVANGYRCSHSRFYRDILQLGVMGKIRSEIKDLQQRGSPLILALSNSVGMSD